MIVQLDVASYIVFSLCKKNTAGGFCTCTGISYGIHIYR